MEWIIFESLLALAILVLIVWWTMRPRKRRPDPGTQRDEANGR